MAQWPRDGLPANPGGWVVAVARRRALDHLRRENARAGKEREAAQERDAAGSPHTTRKVSVTRDAGSSAG